MSFKASANLKQVFNLRKLFKVFFKKNLETCLPLRLTALSEVKDEAFLGKT